jgi:hypothetical protein
MPVEFTAVVSLHVLDLAIKEDMEAVEEIAGGSRAVGDVHPGKGHLGMPVDGGEDLALLAFPVAYHSIETEEKSRHGFSLEFGDFLAGTSDTAFAIDPCLLCGFIVQA